MFGREAVGHRQQQALGQPHEFGIAARVVVRIADRLDATAAQQDGEGADTRARFESLLSAGSELDNLGAELMAHHDVATQIHAEGAAARAFDGVDHFVGELQSMKVGAADSTGQRLDENFAGAELRNRHLIDDEFFVSHYGGAHRNLRGWRRL